MQLRLDTCKKVQEKHCEDSLILGSWAAARTADRGLSDHKEHHIHPLNPHFLVILGKGDGEVDGCIALVPA